MGIIGLLLTDTPDNIRGWKSIQLNPDEPDSSVFVRRLEQFIMEAMATADVKHPEDYPPYYNATLRDMTMHWKTEAYTYTSMRVYPDNLAKVLPTTA